MALSDNHPHPDEVQEKIAAEIYGELKKSGVEVLVDDRKERPGVKFNDADLIGIPIRITVGRDAENREVEYKLRRESDSSLLKVEDAIKLAIKTINPKYCSA